MMLKSKFRSNGGVWVWVFNQFETQTSSTQQMTTEKTNDNRKKKKESRYLFTRVTSICFFFPADSFFLKPGPIETSALS